ncbi:MAG TPA: BREX-2 system phosphatase PglZ, partial [Longimicrobium sp.]
EGGLAAALDGLNQAVLAHREDENRRFAERLAEWHHTPGREPGVIPIDRVLDDVVAPAAAVAPVLLLVLDGMGFSSFRQLYASLGEAGWQEWLAAGHDTRPVALAAAPSITRVSRTSLFAGRLLAGAASDERREIARHAGLVARSRAKRLPRLFHKGDLTEGASAGLTEAVREALRDSEQQVVGIVLNVLDDSLTKSDQALPSWTVDRIRLLEPILFEARVAGRLLVLASDHGHVLDAESLHLTGGDEERWRPYSEPIAPEEMVLAGPRVQAAVGAERIVVPWSERVRYVRRKAGYHGGASAQEMMLPLAVLAAWDRQVEGWTVASERPPRWWSPDEAPAAPIPALAPEPSSRKKPRAPAVQPSLFAEPAEVAPAPPPTDWITQLLASDAFAGQRAIAGRAAPANDVVRAFLEVLDRHHGRMPRALLVRALGVPEIRIRGLLASLQRLLNLDGYPVVAVDEATGTVELNRELLRTQFSLEERR